MTQFNDHDWAIIKTHAPPTKHKVKAYKVAPDHMHACANHSCSQCCATFLDSYDSMTR